MTGRPGLDQWSETSFFIGLHLQTYKVWGFKANGQIELPRDWVLQLMNDNCSCGYMSEESNYKAHRFSSRRASECSSSQLGPRGKKKSNSPGRIKLDYLLVPDDYVWSLCLKFLVNPVIPWFLFLHLVRWFSWSQCGYPVVHPTSASGALGGGCTFLYFPISVPLQMQTSRIWLSTQTQVMSTHQFSTLLAKNTLFIVIEVLLGMCLALARKYEHKGCYHFWAEDAEAVRDCHAAVLPGMEICSVWDGRWLLVWISK